MMLSECCRFDRPAEQTADQAGIGSSSDRCYRATHTALAIDEFPPQARLHAGSEAKQPLAFYLAYSSRIMHERSNKVAVPKSALGLDQPIRPKTS